MQAQWTIKETYTDGKPQRFELKPCTGCIVELSDKMHDDKHTVSIKLSTGETKIEKKVFRLRKDRPLEESKVWAEQEAWEYLQELNELVRRGLEALVP